MCMLNVCAITNTLFYICLLKLFVFANSCYVILWASLSSFLCVFSVFPNLDCSEARVPFLFSFIVMPTRFLFIRVVFADADAAVLTHVLNGIYIPYSTLVNHRQMGIRAPWLSLVLCIFFRSPFQLFVFFFAFCSSDCGSTEADALLLACKHIHYSLLHMYELFLFTFPFFQILVSFVHFVCSLFLTLYLSTLQCSILSFSCLLSFCCSFISFIIFLRSIASHLIHLNSFSYCIHDCLIRFFFRSSRVYGCIGTVCSFYYWIFCFSTRQIINSLSLSLSISFHPPGILFS